MDKVELRRQHSVGNYILDFYCPSEKLAIELDGEVHYGDAARVYDYERRLFLEYYGIKVLRFENKKVFEDLEWMLDVIKNNFGWNKKTTPPLRATPPFEGGEFGVEDFSTDLENLELKNNLENLKLQTTKNTPPFKGGVAVASTDGVVDLQTFTPIDILDYIYAVLHSPAYRARKIQGIFENRFSACSFSERCRNLLAIG